MLRVLNDQEFFIACAGHSDGNPCLAPHAALLDAFKLQVRRIQPPAVPSKQSAPFLLPAMNVMQHKQLEGEKQL